MPFWIRIEINEETVSVLRHKTDRRRCTSEYHVPDFFSILPVCRIFLLCSPVSGDVQELAHAWRWRFPISSRGRSQFYFFVFILDRISPRCNISDIMAQRGKSQPIPIPPKGFYSVNIVKLLLQPAWLLSSNPFLRVGFSSLAGH